MKRTRAVIYTRVSHDPNGRQRSVREQQAECRQLCEDRGWTVLRVFEDNDRSASEYAKGQRRAFVEMKGYLESHGADVLVAWESSRLSRSTEDAFDLWNEAKRFGMKFCLSGRMFDTGESDDKFRYGLDALLNALEADRTHERVMRAIRSGIDSGRPHGKKPYGYDREYDPHTRELVAQVIRHDQAAVIQECARRFLAGETANAIARDLNERGVPTPRASTTTKGWTLSQVRQLLTNPTYIARRTHKGRVTGPGTWPPILTDEDFYACQAKFNDPRRKSTTERATKYLLTGIARCGVCGATVKAMPNRGHLTYQCREKWCIARNVERLDAFVVGCILARLARPDFLGQLSEGVPLASAAVEKYRCLEAEVADLVRKAGELDLPIEVVGARHRALTRQMEELEPSLRPARRPSVLVDLALDPQSVWERLTIDQKRECVRTLCTVEVRPTGRGVRRFDPTTVTVSFAVDRAGEPVAQAG